jgi:hydroxypyruvate isomerase
MASRRSTAAPHVFFGRIHEIESSGRSNVKLQLDLYHCQISQGDLIRTIERDIALIAHVQIAGVPDHSEPSQGEIAYANVFARLESLGYSGHIGCEYEPASDTLSGLSWAAPYLQSTRPGDPPP